MCPVTQIVENMKNAIKSAAVALLSAALGLVLVGCKGAAPAPTPEFATIEKTQHLTTTTGNFELTYRFEYLSAGPAAEILAKVQTAMASDFFGAEYARTDAARSAEAFDGAAQANYGTRPDGEFRWDGYLHINSTATALTPRLVSYTITRAEDAGGAHVMETTDNATYDLATGNRLSLDDLFTPEGKAALAETIRAQILKDKGLATWEELMSRDCFNAAAELTPSENFSLTASAITFVYNPYDIACYAAGATNVTLPLANLAGFKPEILAR